MWSEVSSPSQTTKNPQYAPLPQKFWERVARSIPSGPRKRDENNHQPSPDTLKLPPVRTCIRHLLSADEAPWMREAEAPNPIVVERLQLPILL